MKFYTPHFLNWSLADKYRPLTRKSAPIAGIIGLIMIVLGAAPTVSQAQIVSRYSPNFATGQFNLAQPRFSSDTQQLVDEIKLLLEEAERAGAADPLFLQDLRAAADRFLWPWRNVVLFDDFSDGNFTDNPQWLNPGGFVTVADNVGLILDGTNEGFGVPGGAEGVPPGFTSSSADAWAGSARSYDFVGSDIISPTARRAIRMDNSLEGDFTFRFQLGDEISPTATIGIYPVSSNNRFRSTSGTGGIDRMSSSWWMVGSGDFREGNERQDIVELQPGDIIEYQRKDGQISVAANGILVHEFATKSAVPVRALIAQSGTTSFELKGVSWGLGDPDGANFTFVQASPASWDGGTNDFDFTGDGVETSARSASIRTIDPFAGDFRIIMRIGPQATVTATRIGLYDIQEDIRFDPTDQAGGMRDMTNSWYILSNAARAGCCTERQLDIERDDIFELRRDGETISMLINNQLSHTFVRRSTAPLRLVIGRGSRFSGIVDVDDIAWTVPGNSGSGTATSSFEILQAALQASTGSPSQQPIPDNSAIIIAPTRVKSAFAVSTIILANDFSTGRFEFGVLRLANAFGYRVAIDTENLPTLQLIRSDNGGDVVLATASPPINIADGAPHLVQLTRNQNGVIKLSIDGADFLSATDLRLRSDFGALALLVQDGLFAVRGVTLLDAPL